MSGTIADLRIFALFHTRTMLWILIVIVACAVWGSACINDTVYWMTATSRFSYARAGINIVTTVIICRRQIVMIVDITVCCIMRCTVAV